MRSPRRARRDRRRRGGPGAAAGGGLPDDGAPARGRPGARGRVPGAGGPVAPRPADDRGRHARGAHGGADVHLRRRPDDPGAHRGTAARPGPGIGGSSARRPADHDGALVHALRVGHRLDPGDGGRDGRRPSAPAPRTRLPGPFRDRARHQRQRHRAADPAQHRHDRLRSRLGNLGRRALHRGHRPGAADPGGVLRLLLGHRSALRRPPAGAGDLGRAGAAPWRARACPWASR